MMSAEPVPNHLRASVGIVRNYVRNEAEQRPLVIQGMPGSGKKHWLDRVAAENGRVPIVLDEPSVAPSFDLQDRPTLPVYYVPPSEFTLELGRSVLVVESDTPLPKSLVGERGSQVIHVAFPSPTEHALQSFLVERGYPPVLVEGNPNYDAVRYAMLAWDVARVHVRKVPKEVTSWAEFRRGGQPPYDGPLLGYYAGENLPKNYWYWNRALALERVIPSSLRDPLLMESLRMLWPPETRFPAVLRFEKRSSAPSRHEDAPADRPVVEAAPHRTIRDYAITDW